MLCRHLECSFGDNLALYLNCSHCISQPILFSKVLRDNLLNLFILRVLILVYLVFNWILLFLITLSLYIYQNGVWIAGKRQSIELISFILIELIEFWKLLENKVFSTWNSVIITSKRIFYVETRNDLWNLCLLQHNKIVQL